MRALGIAVNVIVASLGANWSSVGLARPQNSIPRQRMTDDRLSKTHLQPQATTPNPGPIVEYGHCSGFSPTVGTAELPDAAPIHISGVALGAVTEVDFGGVPSPDKAFPVQNDGSIIAFPPSGMAGMTVPVTVKTGGNVLVCPGSFSFEMGYLRVTGPHSYDPEEIGDSRWAGGQFHTMMLSSPVAVPISTPSPVFHVTVEFANSGAIESYTPPYVIGNQGYFEAFLQVCDVQIVAPPGLPPPPPAGAFQQCNDYTNTGPGYNGWWVSVTPISHVLVTGPGRSDLALQPSAAFDFQHLARTFRIVVGVGIRDTNTGNAESVWNDGTSSNPFKIGRA